MAQNPTSAAVQVLKSDFKSIQDEPVEGFRVKLASESNIFEWEVVIFGPPNTLYEGGYFKARMNFPPDYPYSPPSFRFLSKVFHPNVYKNGDLCISILHPNPISNERKGGASDGWNPTQNVRTILISVISLLNEPNISSAANFEAAVMYKRWRDSKDKDKDYENMIRKHALSTRAEAVKDGVRVPRTLEEYCIKHTAKPPVRDPFHVYEREEKEEEREQKEEKGQKEEKEQKEEKGQEEEK